MLNRIRLISVIFVMFAAVLLFRLIFLQVYQSDDLAAKADAQEFHTVELEESPRGGIIDHNGTSITSDAETFALLIVPFLVDDPASFSENVGKIAGLSSDLLQSKIVGISQNNEELRKQPFVAKTDLTKNEMDKLNAINENGLYIVSRQGRYYRDFPAQHLLGSLGKSEDSEETVGLSGLERIYDSVLSAGSSRKISFLIDEKNRMIDPDEYYVEEGDSVDIGHLELTVDLGIQRAAEDALGDLSGAIVVLDSSNGDVLALASSPKYDPYLTTKLLADDVYVNKALSAYPPASLFKIFVSAIALENGTIAQETAFFCNGSYELENGAQVSCWEKDGHGFLTFEDALACSCNPVFLKTTFDLGGNALESAFSQWELDKDLLLGYSLNDMSSLDITGTGSALANVGLGESGVLMTPLNVAKMINVIASGGMLYTPRVVKDVYDRNGEISEHFEESTPLRVISEETADIVTLMMAKTFRDGTAKSLNLAEFHIAGKTGTSETGNVWIGGFFPYEDPQYTIVILVSGGTSGVGDGGPVMKKLCAYLGNLS